MKSQHLLTPAIALLLSMGSTFAQTSIAPGILPASASDFEVSGTQNITSIGSTFDWRRIEQNVTNPIVRTVSRNDCNLVGNGGNNASAGFTTNSGIPGVPFGGWNGEVHEFWESPTGPITDPCFTNNKYISLQVQGQNSVGYIGVVHDLATTVQAGDEVKVHFWYGWKTMSGTPQTPFRVSAKLMKEGGDEYFADPLNLGSREFPTTSLMQWEEATYTFDGVPDGNRIALFFIADMSNGLYHRFYLDDIDVTITINSSNLPTQPGSSFAVPNGESMRSSEDTSITLAPNPTNGTFQLYHGAFNSEQRSIVVYNSTGALVKQVIPMNDHSTTIDLEGEPAGAYLVKYADGDRVETVRLLKE